MLARPVIISVYTQPVVFAILANPKFTEHVSPGGFIQGVMLTAVKSVAFSYQLFYFDH